MTATNVRALTRTERSRADATKAGGVHYTPPELASFVAASALAAAPSLGELRVLDPACGDGALLAAIAEMAQPGRQLQLVGCDRDRSALEAADVRLAALGLANVTWTWEECDFLSEAVNLRSATESLFEDDSAEALSDPFDIVVANPPYVRTQVLGAEEAQRLAAAFGLSGRVDLYHAFAVAMTESLRPNGVLALLCSNRFMTTKGGRSLRSHLESKLNIEHIFDLGDTKLFEAAVLPAVVIATRQSPSGIDPPMASIYEEPVGDHSQPAPSVLAALEGGLEGSIVVGKTGFDIRRGTLRGSAESAAPWILATKSDEWVGQVNQRMVMQFGDLGKIRVGIKSTADKVFISDDWDALGASKPESDVLLPLLTHHGARRWDADAATYKVLYPYDLNESKRVPLDITKWPRTEAYLQTHRDRLEGRSYVVDSGRHWWEIWVPQRPSEWSLPKLVFPDISEKPRFSLDTSGSVVNGDCYWLALTTTENEYFGLLAMAVANSTLGTRYYDSVCGNKLYSGRRRYITQYVERFPIPDPTSPESCKILGLVSVMIDGGLAASEIANMENEIDDLVWRSFGFEQAPG